MIRHPIRFQVALTAVLLLAAGFTPAEADPISGTISFDGIATTNTGNLANATAFTSIWAFTVPIESGDYSGVPYYTAAAFTPFAFNATSVTPLWTFAIGGITYSFDATSSIVVSQSANFLDVSGAGIASITGYTDTAGNWSITDTSQGGSPVFTFGAANAVPDSGATAGLTILGCLALAAASCRRWSRRFGI